VDIASIPAIDHMFPERIAPAVEKYPLELRDKYDRVVVIFGDCGSRGALDKVLARYGIEYIAGSHCTWIPPSPCTLTEKGD
jgi:hypothetical protein